MTTLREVFEKHGSDKAAHGYAAFYETLPAPARMLEVGVWKGASLRAWREWWPDAQICVIDTFSRAPVSSIPELCDSSLTDGKVGWIKADSREPNYYLQEWASFPDLIIDDGSHRPRNQAATLRNLWPLLAPGGTYAVEDVVLYDRPLPAWFDDRHQHFNRKAYAELMDARAETGATWAWHDYRDQSGKPDSVLLVLRKPL